MWRVRVLPTSWTGTSALSIWRMKSFVPLMVVSGRRPFSSYVFAIVALFRVHFSCLEARLRFGAWHRGLGSSGHSLLLLGGRRFLDDVLLFGDDHNRKSPGYQS